MKKLALVLAVAVLLCAAWITADRWGAARLARYVPAWRARAAALDDADARLRSPVLRGATVREGNAVALEAEIVARLAAKPTAQASFAKLTAETRSPFAPLTADEQAALDAHRSLVDDLARAVECARCDHADRRYENAITMPAPDLMGCRLLAYHAIAAGHERARAGDLRRAADRYLDAARFGVDVSRGKLLIESLIGAAIVRFSLRPLGALATDAPSGTSAPLDEIDAALRVLEPALPDAAHAIERETLLETSVAARVQERGARAFDGWSGARRMIARVAPARALAADLLPFLDDRAARAAAAVAIADRGARQAALTALDAGLDASGNPLAGSIAMPYAQVVESYIAIRSRLAVTRLALAVERRRLVEGRAPASLEEKDLPIDPSGAPARLRYEATGGGAGYRIWSVGEDGRDDGGVWDPAAQKDDLVAERKAP